jgi:hypothetical protein
MPLDACPKCGYAVSMIDHQCRHCSGPSRALDGTVGVRTIFIAVILAAAIYWAFFAH